MGKDRYDVAGIKVDHDVTSIVARKRIHHLKDILMMLLQILKDCIFEKKSRYIKTEGKVERKSYLANTLPENSCRQMYAALVICFSVYVSMTLDTVR